MSTHLDRFTPAEKLDIASIVPRCSGYRDLTDTLDRHADRTHAEWACRIIGLITADWPARFVTADEIIIEAASLDVVALEAEVEALRIEKAKRDAETAARWAEYRAEEARRLAEREARRKGELAPARAVLATFHGEKSDWLGRCLSQGLEQALKEAGCSEYAISLIEDEVLRRRNTAEPTDVGGGEYSKVD
jgi:hypothetical protein